MEIVSKGRTINLNEDQIKSLSEIKEFLKDKSKDNLFMCLSGAAGTGKTTIIKEAIRGRERSAVVTAPTHQATIVISESVGIQSKTIHSLLGLRPDMELDEFSEKNLLFSQSANSAMHEYSLVIIDESSMLNSAIVKLITETAKTFYVKVIFIGDKNQLPPIEPKDGKSEVKQKISSVFTRDDIKQSCLTKIERQKDSNPLLDLYIDILSNMESRVDLYKKETRLNETQDEGCVFTDNIKEFGDSVEFCFRNLDLRKNKIICYKNDTVRKWNNYVRKAITGDIYSPIENGEILKSYRTIHDKDSNSFLFKNSSEYELYNILSSEKNGYKGFYCNIRNVYTDETSKIFILDNNDLPTIMRFANKENELSKIAKEAEKSDRSYKWMNYFNFRNSYQLVRDIIDPNNSKRILVKKDFDFAYALTIHKAQGSTFERVFIDETDINTVTDNFLRNSLKYVAFTRPTGIAYVYYKP